MGAAAAGRSLVTLAVLASVTAVTGAAFIAVTYTEWNWLSASLGAVVTVLVVICVYLALEALENWQDARERDTSRRGGP